MRVGAVVAGVALLFCATPAGAQSLAELSRQTEEKRAARAADELLAYRHLAGASYFGSEEAVDLALTVPIVQRLAAAWSNVLRAEIKDPAMARRYMQAMVGAKTAEDSERIMTGEAPVRAAVSASGMSVHEFMTARLAFQLASQVVNRKYPPGVADFGNVGSNARLLTEHRAEVDAAMASRVKLEHDLDAAVEVRAAR